MYRFATFRHLRNRDYWLFAPLDALSRHAIDSRAACVVCAAFVPHIRARLHSRNLWWPMWIPRNPKWRQLIANSAAVRLPALSPRLMAPACVSPIYSLHAYHSAARQFRRQLSSTLKRRSPDCQRRLLATPQLSSAYRLISITDVTWYGQHYTDWPVYCDRKEEETDHSPLYCLIQQSTSLATSTHVLLKPVYVHSKAT